MEKLSFEAVKQPLVYELGGRMIKSEEFSAITRSDDDYLLSVVKNSYAPIYNEELTEMTERISEISGFEVTDYSEFGHGRIVFSHLKNTHSDFAIGGCKIDDYLLLGNSFDGSYPFFIGTTTNLLRCKNQFSRIRKAESVRHTTYNKNKRDQLMKTLEIYFEQRKQMYADFNRMREVKVDEKTKQLAIDYVLQLNREETLDKMHTRTLNRLDLVNSDLALEMNDLGNNLWGMFNGFTKYTTHDLKKKEPTFGNLFGNAFDVNKRAYDFAVNLIN